MASGLACSTHSNWILLRRTGAKLACRSAHASKGLIAYESRSGKIDIYPTLVATR